MKSQELPRGLLSPAALKQMVDDGTVETVLVVFPDMYGRLMGKRVTGHFFLEHILQEGMHACDYLLASDMEMTPVPGYRFTSWEAGYGDVCLKPELHTLRNASWLEKTAMILCDVCDEENDELVSIAPRSILRKQVERLATHGYSAYGATELEFFIFKDSYEEAARKQYLNLEPVGNYIEDYHIFQGTKEEEVVGAIRHHLDNSGVPVENSKGEWGPGQQELNVRYAELLEMADRHVIYKHAAKEIAWQKGRSLTFMAKWNTAHAGSSMHVHVSLWDRKTNKPLFPGNEKLGSLQASPIFRWFLGGWMARIRELFPFYAPYPVSYKRYVGGSFAPTAIGWSYDNRTAAFRIVGQGPSLRIECRTPGADANPYLVFAAILAAGLDGIENKTEPPPMLEGDLYKERELLQAPRTLHEAILSLEGSSWARSLFGNDVIDHYLHFFRTEQRKFDETVTNWELARYFERA